MSSPPTGHPTQAALAAFAAGTLATEAAVTIRTHLQCCASCRQAVGRAGRTGNRLQVRSDTRLPGGASPPGTRVPAMPLEGKDLAPQTPGIPSAEPPPELAEHPRYRVIKQLGRGGMGTVYQAEQVLMGRPVAIKVINPGLLDQPDALERFHREVRTAAKLSHPNIVTAHDAEQVGKLHMLVMEYIEGHNLDRVLHKAGRLPVALACNFIHQAALGLQHAHEQGMVHRDIKPQNLMLTAKGQIKILDFGLAKLASERGQGQGLTAINAYMGTPEYSSPEQSTDARTADIRADIYSLGCTLYCLLAGHPPFQGDTDVKIILAHIDQPPRPLPELRPDIPAQLWAVAARMLAKDPAQRYQTPAEAAQALLPFAKQAAKAATLDTRLPRAGTTTGTERTPKAKSLSLAMDEQRATKSRAKEKQRGGSFSWTGRGKASRAFKRLGTVLNVVRLSKGRLAPVRIATAIAVALLIVAAGVFTWRTLDGKPPSDVPKPSLLLTERPATPHAVPSAPIKKWLRDFTVTDWKADSPLQNFGSHSFAVKVVRRDSGYAYLLYHIRGYRSFHATVSLTPSAEQDSASPLRFAVFGDGKLLWVSEPIQKQGESDRCICDVTDISELELRVRCAGANQFAWGAWIDPYLIASDDFVKQAQAEREYRGAIPAYVSEPWFWQAEEDTAPATPPERSSEPEVVEMPPPAAPPPPAQAPRRSAVPRRIPVWKVVFPGDVLLTTNAQEMNDLRRRFPGEFKGDHGSWSGLFGFTYAERRPGTALLRRYNVRGKHLFTFNKIRKRGYTEEGGAWVLVNKVPGSSLRLGLINPQNGGREYGRKSDLNWFRKLNYTPTRLRFYLLDAPQ